MGALPWSGWTQYARARALLQLGDHAAADLAMKRAMEVASALEMPRLRDRCAELLDAN